MKRFIRNSLAAATTMLMGTAAFGPAQIAAQNPPAVLRADLPEKVTIGVPNKQVYTVQGRVIAYQPAMRHLRLRTADGSELALRAAVERMLDKNGKELTLANLVEGAPITVLYELQPVAITITAGPTTAPVPTGAVVVPAPALRGKFVRVLGPDTFLLTTEDGRETKVSLADRASLRLNGRDVKLTDFPEGARIVVFADKLDGSYVVRRLESPELPPTVPVTGPTGHLHGRMFEADRLQPDVEVVLRTDTGIDVANTYTQKNGAFVFQNLKPGLYRIFSYKPVTKTAGEERVTVEANKDKAVLLELSR